jgi:hypothetical protein
LVGSQHRRERLLPRGDELVGATRDDRLQQHLLAAVVVVHQRDVHARTARDRSMRRRRIAFVGDERLGSIEQSAARECGLVPARRDSVHGNGFREISTPR